eukprot:1756910-Rhodomonas_salina.3
MEDEVAQLQARLAESKKKEEEAREERRALGKQVTRAHAHAHAPKRTHARTHAHTHTHTHNHKHIHTKHNTHTSFGAWDVGSAGLRQCVVVPDGAAGGRMPAAQQAGLARARNCHTRNAPNWHPRILRDVRYWHTLALHHVQCGHL